MALERNRFYYINIAFSNIFLTVLNILFVYIHYFVLFISEFNILPLPARKFSHPTSYPMLPTLDIIIPALGPTAEEVS